MNRADFEEMYRTHEPRVRAHIHRRISDWGRTEDLVQETFLRAWRERDRLSAGRPVWPWLVTVASNLCIDHLRSLRTSGEVLCDDLEALCGPLVAVSPGPAESVESLEERTSMRRAMRLLNGRHRRLLYLRHVEGRRYREIAEIEGSHPGALRSVAKRARTALRHAYAGLLAGIRAPALATAAGAVSVKRALAGTIGRAQVLGDRFAELPSEVAAGAAAVAVAASLGAGAVTLAPVNPMPGGEGAAGLVEVLSGPGGFDLTPAGAVAEEGVSGLAQHLWTDDFAGPWETAEELAVYPGKVGRSEQAGRGGKRASPLAPKAYASLFWPIHPGGPPDWAGAWGYRCPDTPKPSCGATAGFEPSRKRQSGNPE